MAFQSSDMAASLTRPGQSNSTGDARALYLKLFSGEMFKGFQNNTIARDLVMRRTLKNGKSLQFIYTGRTTAEYHTCLLYTSPSPRDLSTPRMPSSA